MTDACRECKRAIRENPVTLDYSKDGTLVFCSERCRLDWLDGLPPGSLILQEHADTPDVTPWNARDDQEGSA